MKLARNMIPKHDCPTGDQNTPWFCKDSIRHSYFSINCIQILCNPESRGGSAPMHPPDVAAREASPLLEHPDVNLATDCMSKHLSSTTHTMKLSTLSCGLLACISPLVSATALTYKLSANERACFYTWVENKGSKIAFYFAVCCLPQFGGFYTIGGLDLDRIELIKPNAGPSRRILRRRL